MTREREAVVFDIDATLADGRHRQGEHPWHKPGNTWADFHATCHLDEPVAGPVMLARLLWKAGYAIVVLSGRGEETRTATQDWLAEHGVHYDLLLLRPDEHAETLNGPYKQAMLDLHLPPLGLVPVLCVDDWPPVAEAVTVCPTLLVNPQYDITASPEPLGSRSTGSDEFDGRYVPEVGLHGSVSGA